VEAHADAARAEVARLQQRVVALCAEVGGAGVCTCVRCCSCALSVR